MKYSNVKKIENVLAYQKIENGFTYITKNFKLFVNDEKLFENVGFNIIKSNQFLIFGYYKDESKNSTSTIFNLETNNAEHIDKIIFAFNVYKQNTCLAYIGEGVDYKTAYYDLKNKQIISVLKGIKQTLSPLFYQDLFIDKTSQTELICVDVNTGETVWQFDAMNLYRSEDENGKKIRYAYSLWLREVYEGKLYLSFYQKKTYVASIIVLDLEDGSIYKHWTSEGMYKNVLHKENVVSYPHFPVQGAIFDAKEGKIINLGRDKQYWEFNLKTEQPQTTDLTDYLTENEIWDSFRPVLSHQGDHLFFCARLLPYIENDQPVNPTKVVALNRRTFKIDWQFQPDTPTGCGGDYLQLIENDKYLCYIGAPNSTLYVFEREP